jgi:Xaa-Pro aminopeptidase
MATQGDAPRTALFPRFSPVEFERRHNAIRDAMDREGLDAIVAYGLPGSVEISWLVNYIPLSPCWLIFPRRGEPALFLHFHNHIFCAREQAIIDDIGAYRSPATATIAGNLRARGFAGSRIGMVSLNWISHNDYVDLQRRLPNAIFSDFGRPFTAIRWVKSTEEMPFVRRSGYLTDLTCEALERELRPGLSEFDIRAIVVGAFEPHESDPGIHFIASTSMHEPDRCVPWQRPTPRTIACGSVVITEITVSYWGYATQIHRPFAIVEEPTPLYRQLFDAALECYESVRKICRPGATSEEIVAATACIEERGFTTYDSVFHGERGKFPELGTRSAWHELESWRLVENMVHVIQPNPVTRDFRAGLQLGAAVIVRPEGGESLHSYPFKFPICGA